MPLADEMKAALLEFKESVLEEVRTVLAEQAEAVEEAMPPALKKAIAKKKGEEEDDEEMKESATLLESMQATLLEVQRANRTTAITAKIAASGLPKGVVGKLSERILEALARRDVPDGEVDGEIAFARGVLQESGRASAAGFGSYQAGDSAHDQHIKALTGWFQGAMVDGVRPIRDLKESYANWNGQGYLDVDAFEMFESFASKYDSGRNHAKLQESLAVADWGQVFADVFYLQMIQQYKASPDYDKWRLVVSDIESVPDFRTRHWTRIGGYNDYSTVAEKETYPTLASPGDEEVTYAIQKYGGIDDISMEMILGDRLGQVRQLPKLMAYAAARTLYKFVFNLVTTTNPTMDYDSVALYHAGSHGNSDTVALSVAGLSGVKVAMRSQTAFENSQEILGTRCAPHIIIVPNELEDRLDRIINPSDAYAAALAATFDTNTELDPHMFKGKGMVPHVYDQLTNAKDWWAVADPAMMPTMVMGFLNGRQEPELFTQDQPNAGSTFAADKISYKLRFVFGGDILDHRAFYYNDVA